MQERHTAEPILPLRLFRDPVFRVAIAMATLFGSVMVGASVFLPLFLQVVTGVSATSSGFLLVPMMTGILVGSSVTGRIVTRSGRYKRYPIIGSLIAFAGIWLFALLSIHSSRAQVSIGLALLGLGVGTATPMLTLVVQNAAPPRDMGISTSSVNFFRSLGSAFGIAIFGAIMNARLDSVLAAKLPSSVKLGNDILSSPAQIRALPSAVHSAVSAAVAAGVSFAFLCSLPVLAVTFVLAWLLREVPLRETLGPAVLVEGMEGGLVFSSEAGPTAPPVTPEPATGTA
jgi:MFS family permease